MYWRIINALNLIRSTVILLFFLWVGELVLFKTNINKSINCNYFNKTLVYYIIYCIFVLRDCNKALVKNKKDESSKLHFERRRSTKH